MSNLSNINNNFIVDDDGKILIGLTLASGASILQVTGDSKFVGIVDVTNFKINGAQGTDGQLLTSTGSGIGWEDNIGGSVFVGATSTDDGTSGAVPQPLAADYLKFLRGDATWATVSLPNDFIPSTAGAVGTAGLVPAPAAGTQDGTYFLNGDGSFSVPPYPAQANDFLTALVFDTSDGVVTATVQNQSDVTVDLDGRYVVGSGSLSDYLPLSGGSLTGDLQVTNEITVNKTDVNTPGKITINGNTSATLQLKSEDTALAANETLGVIEFYGSDGSTPGAGVKSSIRARNGDQVGGIGNKSNLIFAVSPGNSSNNIEAMRINPTGSIAIDGATKYGTSGQILTSAGDAPPTWEDAPVSGVTEVTGTLPISVTTGDEPVVSISQSSASSNGYLSSTDWTTFNSKTSNTGTVTGTGTAGTVTQWKTGGAGIEDGPIVFTPPTGGNTGETTYFTSAVPGLSVFHGRLNLSNIPDGGNGLVLAAVTDKAPQITFRNTSALAVIQASDNKALLFYTGGAQTASDVALTLDASQDASFAGDITATGELTVSGTGQSSFGGQVTVPTTPSAATDAASKGYVLSQVGGLGTFQGGYDATTDPGSPVLTGASNIAIGQGDFYTVTVGGDITFSDTPTGDATLEPGDFIFASTDIGADSDPASTEFTLVLADQNIAGAGSSDANTAKGIAGFNSVQFSVSNTGWVQSKISTATVSGLSRITAGTGITTSYAADGAITVTNSSTDTGTPAILSNGTVPTLNSGITGPEVRTLIGAGTSSLTIGNTGSTAMAGNTTTISSTQAAAIVTNSAKTSDTGVPAMLSNGTAPSLNTGISAAEVRTLIGAGTGSGDGTLTSLVAGTGITLTNASGPAVTVTNSAPNIVQTSVTGNAGTATALQTARTINAVSFNGTANIMVPSIYDGNYRRITNPGGAEYVTTSGSVTGAIEITLPVWTNPMLRMTIQVYEYVTNESFTLSCGGHNSGTSWYNTFAYIVSNPGTNRNFTVRFGRNAAGKPVVYIGELASTWSYPQVFVTDFQNGYAGHQVAWTSGWSVGFRTASFEGVTGTITNSQVGYQATTNVANSVVLRDGSGGFSAGAISGTTFNGLAINTSGTNNVANQIVRTQGSGYANFGWINSVSGNHTGTITRITASSDAYLRYVTPAQFRAGVTDGYYATGSGVTSIATTNGITGGTITATGTIQLDSTVVRTTGDQSIYGNKQFYPSSTGTGYSTAAIELMASSSGASGTPPRIGFHWGGVVASSIAIESNGTIVIRDNPGTGYEDFKALNITATGSITVGDGHFIGDDSDDNLLLSSSTNENLIVRAGVGLRFEVDGNASPADLALNIDNAMSATFGGYVYIPTYLFHVGDTNTRIGFTSGTVTVRGDTSIYLDGPVTTDGQVNFLSNNFVVGGTFANNAYSSTTGARLMFGGGNSDAIGNYYIGTNLENFGGNYNKLDLRWHTGIRIGAQPSYGGVRIYDSEDLGTVLFSVGTSGTNVAVTNQLLLNGYTATNTSSTPGTGVAPVQNYSPAGGIMSDTTSDLGTMANGNVVRTAQEATFEFTRAEMNALATGNNGGTTLINAPGSNKFVMIEKATFLIYYSYNSTTVSTSQRYEIQQDSDDPNNADLVAFMTGETVNAIVYANGAASAYNYGTYENDTGRSTLNRTYRPNKATTLRRITTSSLATAVTSIRIKLRYRVWEATTF